MLDTIELAGSGRRTTRLGFGGSGLMGGLSERGSLRLLETAYEAGIRHFDVAPSYGHGAAERCLGKFLRGKADQVTVATKYGILPPPRTALLGVARSMVRPLARQMPAVRRRAARAAAGLQSKAHFTAREAARSLERSLRELDVGRIDLWLLHEATADDLDESDLLPLLQTAQQDGRIGVFGVGGDRSHVDALWRRHRDFCPVLQFDGSPLNPAPDCPGAFRIDHRVIAGALDRIASAFERDLQLCRRWSAELSVDLSDSGVLTALLLGTALNSNPGGMVLFSSRTPARIRTNAQVADDPGWAARSQRFLELFRSASPPL